MAVVDWTDVLGPGPRRRRLTRAGVLLAPLDRDAMELVWHADGYPSGAAYLDTHRLTDRRHRAWTVGGSAYQPACAEAAVQADAEDFVERVAARGGPCVVAFDTELLGHFWPEGVDWLRAVIEVCERRGLPLEPLTADVSEATRAPGSVPVTSCGACRDLRTWSAPAAGGLAWAARAAELQAFAGRRVPGPRALRELLALQASDWAFLVSAGTAGDYPAARAQAHREALTAALADPGADPALRNLALAI